MPRTSSSTNRENVKQAKTVKEVSEFCNNMQEDFLSRFESLEEDTRNKLSKLTDSISTPRSQEGLSEDEVQKTAAAIQAMQGQLERQIAAVKQGLMEELGSVKKYLRELDDTVKEHGERIDSDEQYSRRNCLLLHGVPERPAEDIVETVMTFVNTKLKVPLRLEDIDRCHRMGPMRRNAAEAVRAGRPRTIIIKLTRYIVRESIWENKKVLKGSGLLITESLTPERAKLLREAKEIAGFRNVWTHDGRIVVLCQDDSRKIITCKREFDIFFQERRC